METEEEMAPLMKSLSGILNSTEFDLIFSSTQLEVSTTDFAGNLVDGPALLLITVIDQNDNRPIFKETRYAGEVLEGSPT
ncbi:cadherin-13, partial [Lates japonicus]